MQVINYTYARDHLGRIFEEVADSHQLVVVTRRGDGEGRRAVVILSPEMYENLARLRLQDADLDARA
jgi:prevent-host-death family protein